MEVSVERRDALRAELTDLEDARRKAEREAATVDQLRHAVEAARWERDARTSPALEVARERATAPLVTARVARETLR